MGPLEGLRVVEFAGIGAAPMCAMLLADLGADVIKVDRPASANLGIQRPPRFNILHRGRPSIVLDLKHPEGVETALRLLESADACIEGFRPGTMERLGLGPEACLARNARLCYGRMTGWGQSGPLAMAAGHDINYIAITGALHSMGRRGEPPAIPLNLIGDFGGGALYLTVGILSAVFEARRSGQGQVIDSAMSDGAASLMTMIFGWIAAGVYSTERGTNHIDGGAYYYDVFECADGRFVATGPIEARFRAQLLRAIGLADEDPPLDTQPPEVARARLREIFRTRTRDAWCALLEGTDACFAPVLSPTEAPHHPHNQARGTFIEVDGIVQPAPAPRFNRTPPSIPTPPQEDGQGTVAALRAWGFGQDEIERLGRAGVLGKAQLPERGPV